MPQPLRFQHRGSVLMLLIIASPFVFTAAFLLWFHLALSPLQRQYLPVYTALTLVEGQRMRPVPVEWVWKAAPGRAPVLAEEADVVEAKSDPALDAVLAGQPGMGLALSPAARAEGWTGLLQAKHAGRPRNERAALQEGYYAGESIVGLMTMPLCGTVLLLLLASQLRARLPGRSEQEKRHGRRVKGAELAASARRYPGMRQDGIRLQLAGRFGLPGPSFSIPRALEASHFLLMGDTGAGKSNAIRQILREVERRGETAVVYDPAGEFTREFFRPERGDFLLNPLDARCPSWHMEAELDGRGVEDAIAAAMLPERPYENGFFTDAPRRVLAALLRRGGSVENLLAWMADPAEIERRLAGTPQAVYLDRKAGPQRAGVLASLSLTADSLALLPEDGEGRERFSTDMWRFGRTRWVFLASRPALRERIVPLHAAWLDLLILRMMEPCINPAKPVWFVLDELASLNRLPQLHTAVTESRKYGNPVVLGFQGRSQIEKRYGQDAEAMLSQPATKIFFRTSEPRAAKWISETLGEAEVERLREGGSAGTSGPAGLIGLLMGGAPSQQSSGRSWNLEIATKPLVLASEVAGLAALHAYLKLGNRVTPLRFRYTRPRSRQPEFIERKAVIPGTKALQAAAAKSEALPQAAALASSPVPLLAEPVAKPAVRTPCKAVASIPAALPEATPLLTEPAVMESTQPELRRSAFRKGAAREWTPVD